MLIRSEKKINQSRIISRIVLLALITLSYLYVKQVSYSEVRTWSSRSSSTKIRLIETPHLIFQILPPWSRTVYIFQMRTASNKPWREIVRQTRRDSASYALTSFALMNTVYFQDKKIVITFDATKAQSLDEGQSWEIHVDANLLLVY
jgi:hypothetical protein